MDGDLGELSSFQPASQFSLDLSILLSLDLDSNGDKAREAAEVTLLARLCAILDEYQEQSYLLDPHLEQLVKPIVERLRAHVNLPHANLSTRRVERLSRLLYFFTKVRGAKTILRLFPHQVSDLGILLDLFHDTPTLLSSTTWELRYILLLWFSLVAMLPFALGTTPGDRVKLIGMSFLASASKERDAAVALLARYYSRPDTDLLPFLASCETTFTESPLNPILSAGLLQTLCDVVKLSSPKSLLLVWPQLYHLLASCDTVKSLVGGAMMCRFRVKLAGRLALLLLPSLVGTEDTIVPEAVEVVLGELLEETHNRDTVVRWSAAKYLARIAERLPPSYSHQVVESLLDIFNEDQGALTEMDDRETALHGASLALAEFARRRQIPPDLIPLLLPCILRVKQGVFPHGIDLLRKIDFFTVGAKKRAFLDAAPVVAEHEEYRVPLVRHLIEVTLAHYDPEIRTLGAGALERILRLDAEGLVPALVGPQIAKLQLKDTSKLHGALLSLASLASATDLLPPTSSSSLKLQIFSAVSSLSPTSLSLPSRNLLLSSSLLALEKSATTSSIIQSENKSKLQGVIDRLVDFVGTSAKRANSIEGKRNGVEALSLLAPFAVNLPVLLDRLLDGFTDYTIDQRGDVGSWVRLATISAVGTEDLNQWRHITWASERVFPFLAVDEYRSTLLEGVVLGLTPHTNSGAFVDYALSLPTFPLSPSEPQWSLSQLFQDLVDLAKRSFASNRIFIPALNAVNTLLESGGLDELESDPRGGELLRQILLLATRSVAQVKSAPRLTSSLKTVILLLAFPSVAKPSASKVGLFLGHNLAWLRQSAAEELYTAAPWDGEAAIADAPTDELVELLAETSWSDAIETVRERSKEVVRLLERVFVENG
ncbi:hypothetical protein RQP46_010514 [Phenoliferia psychrophenolica]